jgi:hypothetical protein
MREADVDTWIEASVLAVQPLRTPAVRVPVRALAEPVNGRLVLAPDMGRR